MTVERAAAGGAASQFFRCAPTSDEEVFAQRDRASTSAATRIRTSRSAVG
jgi:hypothetical protein